jgi:gamma-glutamylcyclotransferase (GGCT)/AIG2-like uncharacterized protein YtfP
MEVSLQHPDNLLFVYGTLRQEIDNPISRLLNSSAKRISRGHTKGRLYMVAEYPGLVLSANEDGRVYGDVYLLWSPKTTYPELDEYEGCGLNDPKPHEYRREVVPVVLDSGITINATTYAYVRDVRGKRLIDSGDFLKQ